MEKKIKSLIKKLGKFGLSVKSKNKGHIDPVCGMEATSDFFKSSYKGTDYYFCSQHCKAKFDANPAGFI